MFKLELRPASSRVMAYFSPVFALLLTVFLVVCCFSRSVKIR
jgi:hypothetical protein